MLDFIISTAFILALARVLLAVLDPPRRKPDPFPYQPKRYDDDKES